MIAASVVSWRRRLAKAAEDGRLGSRLPLGSDGAQLSQRSLVASGRDQREQLRAGRPPPTTARFYGRRFLRG